MKTIVIICVIALNGCAPFMKAFSVESPRPNREQLETAKDISSANVPIIAGMQTDKQSKIASVARAGLFAISRNTSPAQSEAVTNIVANAVQAIQDADGTAKILGKNQEETLDSVLRMSTAQYMAAVAGQGSVAMRNQQAVYSGIKTGWEWTRGTIAAVIGGGGGGLGLAGLAAIALRKALQRKQLLVATGEAIEDFRVNNKESGEILKNHLTQAHSTVALDAKKEFGLT